MRINDSVKAMFDPYGNCEDQRLPPLAADTGTAESIVRGVPVVAWDQARPTVTVGPGAEYRTEPLEVGDFAVAIIELPDNPAKNQVTEVAPAHEHGSAQAVPA